MRHVYVSLLLALAWATPFSCTRTAAPGQKAAAEPSHEIVLQLDGGFQLSTDTKTTEVSSLPTSLYWGASTGSAGSETQKWAAASGSVTGGAIHTGKYQTLSPTSYNYYVANQTFSIASAATTLTVADNSKDIIAGRTGGSSSLTPSVTLEHIFARTGTLTMSTQSGYTISGISWTIVSKGSVSGTAGTYNLTTGSWTAASAPLSSTAVTTSSDLYLIPGTYTVTCQYTLSKGDYSDTFSRSADVTLVKGKINSISGTATGGAASEIVLTVSLNDWGDESINASFV